MTPSIHKHLKKTVLMSHTFMKENFVVVNLPQTPTQALTGHYAIIFAYYKLKSVVKKLVLPHKDIGKSLHTLLKGGFISLKLY